MHGATVEPNMFWNSLRFITKIWNFLSCKTALLHKPSLKDNLRYLVWQYVTCQEYREGFHPKQISNNRVWYFPLFICLSTTHVFRWHSNWKLHKACCYQVIIGNFKEQSVHHMWCWKMRNIEMIRIFGDPLSQKKLKGQNIPTSLSKKSTVLFFL